MLITFVQGLFTAWDNLMVNQSPPGGATTGKDDKSTIVAVVSAAPVCQLRVS